MSVLDSRIVYISENNFNLITSPDPSVTYKIKDMIGQPEFTWDGEKFVQSMTYPKGDVIDFSNLYLQNTKFGTANSYSTFDQGSLIAYGDAISWVDIDFPIIIRTTGTGIPTLQAVQGNITAPQWAVNDYNVCEGQEMIHPWVEGSDVHWHCHMITNGTDTTNRYVKWEIEWIWADAGGQISSTILTVSSDILIPANTPTKTHILAPIGTYTLPAKIACHVYARLKRVTSSGTAPTGNPWCSMLQMHVKVNNLGSQNITLK